MYYIQLLPAFIYCAAVVELLDYFKDDGNHYIVMLKYDFTLYSLIHPTSGDIGTPNRNIHKHFDRNAVNYQNSSFNHNQNLGGISGASREERCQKFIANIRYIAHSLCMACQALHDLNIIHADIKPENIFLRFRGEGGVYNSRGVEGVNIGPSLLSEISPGVDYQVCLGDFGSALLTSEVMALYASPTSATRSANVDKDVNYVCS